MKDEVKATRALARQPFDLDRGWLIDVLPLALPWAVAELELLRP